MVKPRSTVRKRLIQRILNEEFQGGPVVYSELRYRVFAEEMTARGLSTNEISRSWANSYAHTIRSLDPTIRRYALYPTGQLPLGIAIREGVFRAHSLIELNAFLDSDAPMIAFKWKPFRVGAQRGKRARQVVLAVISLWDRSNLPGLGDLLAITHVALGRPISVISKRMPTKSAIRICAHLPWKFARMARIAEWDLDAYPETVTESGNYHPEFGWISLSELRPDRCQVPFRGLRVGIPIRQTGWDRRWHICLAQEFNQNNKDALVASNAVRHPD